jgi:hypothetical protein
MTVHDESFRLSEFLVPGDASPVPGTAIVLHLDGEIVGHGHVVGRRLPEAE